MDRIDSEVVERRTEYERALLRGAEAKLRAEVAELQAAEHAAVQRRASFAAVYGEACARIRTERATPLADGATAHSPKVALQRCEALLGQFRVSSAQAGKELAGAESRKSVAQRTLSVGQSQVACHSKRVEVLTELVRDKRQHMLIAQECARSEDLSQLVGAQRMMHLARESYRGAPRKSTEGAAEQACESAGACDSDGSGAINNVPEAAPLDSESSGRSIESSSREGQSLPERRQNDERASAHATTSAGWRSALSAQRNASQVGVEAGSDGIANAVSFGFQLHNGRMVKVRVHREAKGEINLSIEPECLADRQTLSRALREVRMAMQRRGFGVCTEAMQSPSGSAIPTMIGGTQP